MIEVNSPSSCGLFLDQVQEQGVGHISKEEGRREAELTYSAQNNYSQKIDFLLFLCPIIGRLTLEGACAVSAVTVARCRKRKSMRVRVEVRGARCAFPIWRAPLPSYRVSFMHSWENAHVHKGKWPVRPARPRNEGGARRRQQSEQPARAGRFGLFVAS
jgi:hypothetical protein